MILAFSGYYPNFKKWFGAPALDIDSGSYLPNPRRSKSVIAPGKWSNSPNNLLATLKRQNTGYGYATKSTKWQKLAAGKGPKGKTFYFLMTSKFGKGTIILTSAGFVSGGRSMFARLDPKNGAKFLDNLYYHYKLK